MRLVLVEHGVSAYRLLHIVRAQIVIVHTSESKTFEHIDNELHELPLASN